MYLGCEIGGTKLQVGIGDVRGNLRHLLRQEVNRRAGAAGILAQFQNLIPPLLKRFRVTGIGVGFGGPYDLESDRTVKSHQIAGWDNFPLRRWFHRQFKLPVVVENDHNCSAYAEVVRGAGRGYRRVLYVGIGTGIGGGLVYDGQLDNGRYGAAEIGHTRQLVRGKWVTLESVAAGLAIERGVSTVAESGRYVGVALANAIAIVNPDRIIIGGGVAQAGARFFRPLKTTVNQLVFPVYRHNFQIVPSQLGPTAVVVGAILLARSR
jgi:glucokinase